MRTWGYLASEIHPRGRGIRLRFPPLQRAQIVELACLEPVAEGLHITHWRSEDLARQAVADGIVPSISDRTVRRISHNVDLQPHRTRYWRTARFDTQFKQRAEKVLWCYANADRLARSGAIASSAPMRYPTIRFWNATQFDVRSPARSSNRSSSTLAMGL